MEIKVNFIKVLLIFFVIFMQSIQLKTEEYQLSDSGQNLFQLRPLPGKQSFSVHLQYNFAPLYCPKTEKIIRTLPSICQEKSVSTLFHSEIDAQFNLKTPTLKQKKNSIESFKSLRNIDEIEKTIYVPRPASSYCQICKQTFSDYLQHIAHPFHQKKIKECAVTNTDFTEIHSILKKRNLLEIQSKKPTVSSSSNLDEIKLRKAKSEQKQVTLFDEKHNSKSKDDTKVEDSTGHSVPVITGKEEQLYEHQRFGSKKRIVENPFGNHETLTISSQKNLEASKECERQKSEKKCVSFKTIDDEEMNSLFDFQLN